MVDLIEMNLLAQTKSSAKPACNFEETKAFLLGKENVHR
jgi:hypothetical protein